MDEKMKAYTYEMNGKSVVVLRVWTNKGETRRKNEQLNKYFNKNAERLKKKININKEMNRYNSLL